MRRLLLIAGTAVPTYLGYYLLTDRTDQRWFYYVCGAVLTLVLADTVRCWLPPAWTTVQRVGLSVICWWIEVEAAQQAVCGAFRWRIPSETDLCVAWFGSDVYRAVAALAISGLVVSVWQPSQPS